jgi:hypothetical protein
MPGEEWDTRLTHVLHVKSTDKETWRRDRRVRKPLRGKRQGWKRSLKIKRWLEHSGDKKSSATRNKKKKELEGSVKTGCVYVN